VRSVGSVLEAGLRERLDVLDIAQPGVQARFDN
jgi:hypothetical protein